MCLLITVHAVSKSPRRDLNSRPLVYRTSALTPELRRPHLLNKCVYEDYLSPFLVLE